MQKTDIDMKAKASAAELSQFKQHVSDCLRDTERELSAKATSSEVAEFQQALSRMTNNKADAQQVQQLQRETKTHRSTISDLGKALDLCTESLKDNKQKTEALSDTLQANIQKTETLQKELTNLEKSSMDQLRQLKNNYDQVQMNISGIHNMLQATHMKCTDMQPFADALKTCQGNISDLQDAMRGKADTAFVQQLSQDVSNVQSKQQLTELRITEGADQVQALHRAKTEQAQELADLKSEFDHVKTIATRFQSKYEEVKQSLIQTFQSRHLEMAELGTVAKETQADITHIKEKLKSKADGSVVNKLKFDVNELDESIKDLKSGARRDVRDLDAEVKELRNAVSELRNAVSRENGQVRQFQDEVDKIYEDIDKKFADLQSQMQSTTRGSAQSSQSGHLESNHMREIVDEVKRIGGQVASLEQSTKENVTMDELAGELTQFKEKVKTFLHEELDQFERSMPNRASGQLEDGNSGKLQSLEDDLRSGTDRIHQLEGAMRNVWSTLDALKEQGGSTRKVIEFRSEIERMEQDVTRLQQEMLQKANKAEIRQLSDMITNQKQIDELERNAQSASGNEVALHSKKVEGIERSIQQGVAELCRVEETGAKELRRVEEAVAHELRRVEEAVSLLQGKVQTIQSRSSSAGRSEADLQVFAEQIRQELMGQVKRVESGAHQKVQALEAAMREAFESSASGSSRQSEAGMRSIEISVDTLKAHVKQCEQSIASKADASDLTLLKGNVSSLSAQMTSLGQFAQQDTAKMDSVQQYKSAILNVQSQINQLKEDLHEKAGTDALQKIKGTVAGIQSQVNAADQNLQEKASTEQIHQLNNAMSGLHSKVSSLEQHKADSSNLQQLQDHVNTWQSRVPTAERMQQLEATMTDLGKHVSRMEKKGNSETQKSGGFADVHTQVELQHFKGIIAGMEKKITDVEQDLHDKVSRSELQQTKRQIMGVDTKIVEVEQMLQDKATLSQVQSVQSNLQGSISSVEQACHEKLDATHLQPLKAGIATVAAQTASVEQSLHDKVCINQMQQLKGQIASCHSKNQVLEQALLDKAESCQVKQLKDNVEHMGGKIHLTVNEAVASQMRQLAISHPSSAPSECGPRQKRFRGITG
mmetsp:Transcript_126665/g.219567  ORF Transcript_126665/g.219567 Transcript_126665/m.219567 type:complete len:1108 (+) Transcript_126665:875-4198(+)